MLSGGKFYKIVAAEIGIAARSNNADGSWRSQQMSCRSGLTGRTAVVDFHGMISSVSIRVEQPSAANPASVYDALMDLDRWAEFMPGVSAASWESRGAPDTGVGGVRKIRLGMGVTRDVIVDGARPHHHSYVARLPWFQRLLLRDYRGYIRIDERPDGSVIVWAASCTPRIPGIRNLNQALERSYSRLAAALAHEAERAESTRRHP